MRTHSEIVREFGALKLAGELNRVGVELSSSTPQRWADRDRIPTEYWDALIELKIATRDELFAAHRPRKRPEVRSAAA
jgi:hypothetical protein